MKKLSALVILLLLTLSLSAQVKLSGTVKVGGSAKVTTQAGGGASDFVTDSLNDTDTVDLSTHSPAVGSTWIDHPHANYPSPFPFWGNRVFSNGGTGLYYNDATPPSADYYVQVDVHAVSIVSNNAGPAGRIDTTADTMYQCRSNSGTSYELRRIVAATAATLGSSTNQLPTAGQTKTVRLVMTGDQISCYVDGVLEIGPITDANITAAGKAGMRATTVTTTTGFHLDNFSAR